MKKWIVGFLVSVLPVLGIHAARTVPADAFHFAAMSQPGRNNRQFLATAFDRLRQSNASFAIVNGIKSVSERCTDELYLERKNLFNRSRAPVILSVAGADWMYCRNRKGDSVAIERLLRIKDIFFDSRRSLGANGITLTRHSLGSPYASYPENAYWVQKGILFATLHMPSDNNRYLSAAGRNNEFEDRTIANRNWLDRIFRLATRQRYRGIVIVSDGNPFSASYPSRFGSASRDGFSEIRQQLNTLVSRYAGRVLFIHGHGTGSAGIIWKGRLGTLGLGPDWTSILVVPSSATVFSTETLALPTGRTGRRLH